MPKVWFNNVKIIRTIYLFVNLDYFKVYKTTGTDAGLDVVIGLIPMVDLFRINRFYIIFPTNHKKYLFVFFFYF